jgi:hypothetical protein
LSNFLSVEGEDNFRSIKDSGKGAVLVTGHFGSWELMGAYLSRRGWPIDYLVGEQHNLLVNKLMNDHRRIFNIGLIEMGVAARGVIKAVKQGRMVCMLSDQDAGSDAAPAPPRREPERTKFYRDTAAVNRAAEDALANWLAVPQSIFYSAPFLDDSNGMDALGRITGFEGAEEVRAPREGPALYERIVLDLDGTVLAPGTRLQIYALEPRRPEMDGLVATPSGVATILHRVEGGVVASVDAHYHRILKGDLVRPLPTYPGVPGRVAQPVSGGVVTHVMGFAGVQDLHQPGHFLFVDVGRRDGIAVGDELVVVEDNPNARIEGRVQVVGVQDDVATARIVMIRNPVFDHGLRLRMDRKMPAR